MSHLAIFALGPLRIELDGAPIQTSRHKALALMVYLAVQPGKQSREALSALLWPDYEQVRAFAYLRRTLWEIRSLLGDDWLEADRAEIGFSPNANLFLDVAEFQQHCAEVARHGHLATSDCPECLAHLRRAVLLYRGDFLTGLTVRDSTAFEQWQVFQRETIRQANAGALQKLARWLYEDGAFGDALLFGQRWLALDTLNEEAHRLLMKIYTATGQRHQALRQYQACAQILQTELGISPEPVTTKLYEAVLAGDLPPARQPALDPLPRAADQEANSNSRWEPSPSQTSELSSGLPGQPTPFIGRRQAVDQIGALLADPDCWLLTLLGPGGIGKTRLALEVGQKQSSAFPQGVCFVSLSMVEQEHALAPAIARSAGLTFRQAGPDPNAQIFDFLREKQMLLILDSFEQMIPWAGLLGKIHRHAPGIRMLVTSRHRLQMQGEWVMEVSGLEYPPALQAGHAFQEADIAGFSAVALFLQAARRTRVSFQALPQDLAAIVRIAQALDGSPLGLELAATWVNALTCQEIADEISRGLDILETSLGDIAERQRSMRAVFDYSWRLLSSREQAIMPCLEVFYGTFTRQAAEQVAGISLRELSGLVDKSLVRRTPGGRFDLHDLLRQYCTEILEQAPASAQQTRSRHAAFFCERLSIWNEQLRSPKQGAALREIETDLENIQEAWDWALRQNQFVLLEQAVDSLGVFYVCRARLAEGLVRFREASQVLQRYTEGEFHPRLARLTSRLLTWQSALLLNLERFAELSQPLEASEDILNDPRLDPDQAVEERIFALTLRALQMALQFDPDRTLQYYRQAMQLAQAANRKHPRLFIFIWRFLMGGAVSRELYDEVMHNIGYVQQSEDPSEIGSYVYGVGISELFHYFRFEKAEPLLRESIRYFHQMDDLSMQVIIDRTSGYLLLVAGEFEEAYALKQQELAVVENIGDIRMIAITRAELGEVLCHLGKYREAEEQIRQALALVKDRSAEEYALRHRYLGDVLLAQGKAEEARAAYLFSYQFFQTHAVDGWCMTALTGLSRAERSLGNLSAAWQYAKQALKLFSEGQLFTFFAYLTVANFALLLADREPADALSLYRVVLQQGYLAKSRWFEGLYGWEMEQVRSRLLIQGQDASSEPVQPVDFPAAVQTLLAAHSQSFI